VRPSARKARAAARVASARPGRGGVHRDRLDRRVGRGPRGVAEALLTAEPTVFVVDDDLGLRRSLQALLEAAGLRVEIYASAQEFLEHCDPRRPGCMVLDVRLQGSSGLDFQEELRRRQVTLLPIIVMTGYGDVSTSVRAFKGGAIDFLQKPVPPKKLLERIREALEIDRQARAVAAQRGLVVDAIARLTSRERQVMDLVALGRRSKEIAATLKISIRTVEGHRRAVLRKMGVSSAAHLARAVARLDRT
jgi:two-component system response regulator FixJ